MVDEDLNVFLMEVSGEEVKHQVSPSKPYRFEANMSPNLSSGHFPPNKLLYEQVIFNLFAVVGVARLVHDSSLADSDDATSAMLVSNKDILIPSLCARPCTDCTDVKCRLCQPCMRESDRRHLKRAYREHLGRRATRRLLPHPFAGADGDARLEDDEKFESHMRRWVRTEEDELMAWWFRGKCTQDPVWCE